MPQAVMHKKGAMVDYTPGADVAAGDVEVIGTVPMVALVEILSGVLGTLASEGIFDVAKETGAVTAGDAVYWDATGDPVGGVGGSGAAISTASGANLMGLAVADAASGATTVRTKLTAAKRTTTIGGAVTASDITAEDATLTITGIAAAQGGAVTNVGGVSATTGLAGGAVSQTGGVGGATGAGGAASTVGGASGATSGTGGAAALTGGAAGSAAGNAVGGAAPVTGGAGKGNLAGGAASVTGGVGGATGAGGATAVTGGAGGSGSGTGGAVTVAGGAGSAGNANGGALTLNGGNANGSGTDGVLNIATANTSVVNLGVMARIPTSTVAAAGTDASNGGALVEGFNLVTAADATKGVVLPTAVAGMDIIVKNEDSANAVLKIWPATSDQINAVAVDGSFDIAAKTSVRLIAYDATNWYSLPLLPS